MKLPRKPKQPKSKSSLATWTAWQKRMKLWQAKCKAIKEAPLKKAKIRDSFR